jgi:hypothetical protein
MLRRLKVIFLYIKTDLYLINPSPPPPPSQRLKEPEAGYTVFPGIAPPPRKLIPHLTDPSTLGLPYYCVPHIPPSRLPTVPLITKARVALVYL